MSDSTYEDDQRIVQEMIGRFDGPSFVRRARLVENAWQELMQRCANERSTRLEIVRLRLGQLHALAGGWDAMRRWMSADDLAFLQRLFAELAPRLRLPLEPTRSSRALKVAAEELTEAIEFFNLGWRRWLRQLDLQPLNRARDAYNRWYLLEKECAFGSATAARRDFQRLPPATLDEIEQRFPLLRVPTFDFSPEM